MTMIIGDPAHEYGSPMLASVYASAWVIPDPRWLVRHLDFVSLETADNLHRVLFHRDFCDLLHAAWYAAREAEEHPVSWTYAWSPRRKRTQRNSDLSTHAYGLAIDINPNSNQYGTTGSMPATWIKAFEDHGFVWGGRWTPCDPMHFQLVKGY